MDAEVFNRIKKMLYGEYVKVFNDSTNTARVFVSDYFKGINSFMYIDAYKTIDKEYVESILRKVFDEKNMALSVVKPLQVN